MRRQHGIEGRPRGGEPADRLELELTEGAAMDNPSRAITVMNELHARGVQLSIDDFGTGYSSLAYLKKFRVGKLKIDQSFVRDLTDDVEDRAIVDAVIRMAAALGLQTLAEGVETEGQLAFLRSHGCQAVQGFLFSRALPAAKVTELVALFERLETLDTAGVAQLVALIASARPEKK